MGTDQWLPEESGREMEGRGVCGIKRQKDIFVGDDYI